MSIKIKLLICSIAAMSAALVAISVKAQSPSPSASPSPSLTGNLTGWAWSSNIGWISFSSSNAGAGGGSYGVNIDSSGYLTGYAWSPSIGWIGFGQGDLGLAPACPNTAAPKVSLSGATAGAVTGWARVKSAVGYTGGWDGCLELSGTNHQSKTGGGVTYDLTTHAFNGFAWGALEGWINFLPNPSGGPGTNVICTGPCPGGGGAPTASCTRSAQDNGDGTITATYTANVSGNGVTAPLWYSWNGAAPVSISAVPTANIYTWRYSSPGGPTVAIKDSATTPLTWAPICQPVTPVAAGELKLYIGKTAALAASGQITSLTVKKGGLFGLWWTNPYPYDANLGTGTICTSKITPPVTFGPNVWASVIDPVVGGTLTGQDTSQSEPGLYEFRITCKDAVTFVETPPVSATLKVISVDEGEI